MPRYSEERKAAVLKKLLPSQKGNGERRAKQTHNTVRVTSEFLNFCQLNQDRQKLGGYSDPLR